MTECPNHELSPLKIDIDFRYVDSVPQRRYTLAHIEGICKLYMEF